MKATPGRSIATRLILVVLGLYSLVALTVTSIQIYFDYRYIKSTISAELGGIQEAFEGAVADSLWKMDQEALKAVVRGMLQVNPVIGVLITDPDGRPLALGGTVSLEDLVFTGEVRVNLLGLGPGIGSSRESGFGFELFDHSFELRHEGPPTAFGLGRMTIFSSSSLIYQRMKLELIFLGINVGITFFTFMIALQWAVRRYLGRPLGELAAAAENVNLDNLGSAIIFIDAPEGCELKVYESSFNDMVCSLDQAMEIRRRIEDELQRKEENLRTTLNSIGEAVITTDIEGTVVHLNPVARELTGWGRSEVEGRPLDRVRNIVNLETREKIEDPVAKVLGSGSGAFVSEPALMISKDGRERMIEYSGAPIKGPADEAVGVVLIIRDITEKYRSQEKIRRSEKLYRQLFEKSPEAIFIVDTIDGRYLEANAAAEVLTGRTAAELKRLRTSDVTPAGARARLDKVVHTNGTFDLGEVAYLRPDGTQRIARLISVPIGDRTSFGIAQDITEKKRAEEELEESRERLQTILEANPDPVVVYDPEGRTTYINPAFSLLFGWSAEELLGARIPFVPEDQQAATLAAIEQLRHKGDTASLETTRLTKDGRAVEVLVSAAVIADGHGRPTGIVVNLTDLSNIRKMESRLLQAQKMESVGRLAGGVAHDFNNMLGVILGNSEIALELVGRDEALRARLEEIQRAAQRSADVTRQLLAFARKQTIAPQVLDLNATVRNMLKMLRRLIGEDIELDWLPAPKRLPVRIDPSQVDQILANLCVNARDAIDGVGRLTIETGEATFDQAFCAAHPGYTPGDFILLSVSDNGSGMDRRTLDNLFEPFFTTKAIDRGTGLGLATVYGIVKQNDGFISVYSELDKGSTFKIYFPVHDERVAGPPEAKDQLPEPGGEETILLVEDEPAILDIASTMLRRLGYRVLIAGTPKKALKVARGSAAGIDLLVTDVIMPGMNGRELATRLKADLPGLAVLFMSGYTADVIVHHGVLEENVVFIQKPFSMNSLAHKVREALDLE